MIAAPASERGLLPVGDDHVLDGLTLVIRATLRGRQRLAVWRDRHPSRHRRLAGDLGLVLEGPGVYPFERRRLVWIGSALHWVVFPVEGSNRFGVRLLALSVYAVDGRFHAVRRRLNLHGPC